MLGYSSGAATAAASATRDPGTTSLSLAVISSEVVLGLNEVLQQSGWEMQS